jgi:hypothetical protein
MLLLWKKKTPLAGDCGVFIETETLTVFWEPMSFMDCFVSHVRIPQKTGYMYMQYTVEMAKQVG